MLKFLIADDQPVVRQGLKQTLAEAFGDAMFGEVQNVGEAKKAVQRQDWNAIVLNLSIPGGGGLNVVRSLKRRHLRTPVLLVSPGSESHCAVDALKSGAAGYLTGQSALDELVGAVRKVLSGGRYISPDLLLWAVRDAA